MGDLEDLVQKRLKEGWLWEPAGYEGFLLLMPPIDDHRRSWAAKWIPYQANKYIPHWI